jgi:hypothetical protein
MRVEVHFTGDSFIAFDPDGQRITNRSILEQISFHPFPGFKTSFYVDVDTNIPEEPGQLNIYTSITTQMK